MHLVAFVVAGQGVHHEVHAEAEGEGALALAARDGRVKRPAVFVLGPGGGPVVAADDHRADAVVAAVLVLLHPDGVAVVTAREVLQQVEGVREHVRRGQRREARDVEPLADPAQRGAGIGRHAGAGAGRIGAAAAQVDHHDAAGMHVAVEGSDSGWRGGGVGGQRVIQQREEAEVIMARHHRQRIGEYGGGAVVHVVGQPRQAGARRRIDLCVAGDDIGEVGRQGRAFGMRGAPGQECHRQDGHGAAAETGRPDPLGQAALGQHAVEQAAQPQRQHHVGAQQGDRDADQPGSGRALPRGAVQRQAGGAGDRRHRREGDGRGAEVQRVAVALGTVEAGWMRG